MNWILPLFVMLSAAGFAAALRSWTRRSQPLHRRLSAYLSEDSARSANRAVQRLFSSSDDRFAALTGRGVARRLRRNRRYAMHLYLRQFREEFRHAARQARDAAAHSETPDASMKILRLTVEFYTLQGLLYAQTYLGWQPFSAELLLRRLEPLRPHS